MPEACKNNVHYHKSQRKQRQGNKVNRRLLEGRLKLSALMLEAAAAEFTASASEFSKTFSALLLSFCTKHLGNRNRPRKIERSQDCYTCSAVFMIVQGGAKRPERTAFEAFIETFLAISF